MKKREEEAKKKEAEVLTGGRKGADVEFERERKCVVHFLFLCSTILFSMFFLMMR